MLALSNLVLAAGLVLLALTQGVVTLVTAWTVLGVGMAMGLYDSAFATLAGLYGRAARGPITGITLIAGFASTVGWPLSALLDAHFGWRGACLVWAALNVLIGLPLNRLLIPEAPPPIRASEVQETAESAPRGAMALLAFVFAATWFVTGAMAAHLPRLLEIAGASTTAAIAAAALVGPAQVGARLVEFGALSRVHPVISARIAAALHPLGAGILAAFGAPVIVAFALFHGAGNGLLTIAKGTLPLAIFGPVGYTNAEIAVKIDFTPDYIAAICYLLEHGEERLLATVERGVMPANIAMEIARAPDGDIQQALAEAYENKLLPGNQILAIRRIILQRNQRRKSPPRTGRGVPNTGKITAAANLMFEIAIIERTGSAKSVWPRPEPLYAAGQDHSRPQTIVYMLLGWSSLDFNKG
jgi:MFS family permease